MARATGMDGNARTRRGAVLHDRAAAVIDRARPARLTPMQDLSTVGIGRAHHVLLLSERARLHPLRASRHGWGWVRDRRDGGERPRTNRTLSHHAGGADPLGAPAEA